MNEIDSTIKWLTSGTWQQDIETAKALAVIMDALREQAERERGCTHCQKPYVSIGGINEDKAIIYLGAERPYTKGNVEYLHHMDSAGRMNAFKVRHCPMCGKRLEVEHGE